MLSPLARPRAWALSPSPSLGWEGLWLYLSLLVAYVLSFTWEASEASATALTRWSEGFLPTLTF